MLLLVVTCGVGKVNENINAECSIGTCGTPRLSRGVVEGSSGFPLGRLWYSTVEKEVQIDLEVGTGHLERGWNGGAMIGSLMYLISWAGAEYLKYSRVGKGLSWFVVPIFV